MTIALAFMASALAICVRAQFTDKPSADDTFIRVEGGEWIE